MGFLDLAIASKMIDEAQNPRNPYLDIAPEVQDALNSGKPVVALESTIISHGMPYPQNVETALNVEKIIRENGAVPATIAILKGRLKAGLSAEEIDYLGKTGTGIPKASRRDLPVLIAKGMDGATTVTTLGAHINEIVGSLDHIQVMLDYNDRISAVCQSL